MIKIVKAEYVEQRMIRLWFSDHSLGDYDLQSLLNQASELTEPLRDDTYFRQFFLELGALCWKNGLELSPGSIYRKLQQQGLLQNTQQAA